MHADKKLKKEKKGEKKDKKKREKRKRKKTIFYLGFSGWGAFIFYFFRGPNNGLISIFWPFLNFEIRGQKDCQ